MNAFPPESSPVFYGISECDLGYLLIARSSSGIRWLSVGGAPSLLLSRLETAFGAEQLTHDPHAVHAARMQIEEYLAGKRREFTLPLDLIGTPFQRSVWRALCEVPFGTTVSYSDIAEFIGMPRALRAVANACGDNPAMLVVPCHRIIRKSGELGGFGGGVEMKQHLLRLERRKTPVLSVQSARAPEFTLG